MTPERLDEIRAFVCPGIPGFRGVRHHCQGCDEDRTELLDYVDELRAQVRAGQQSIARESHRQAVQAHNAANLLAHQQARGMERSEFWRAHHADARTEVAALRAKLEQAEMETRDRTRLLRDVEAENQRLTGRIETLSDALRHLRRSAQLEPTPSLRALIDAALSEKGGGHV